MNNSVRTAHPVFVVVLLAFLALGFMFQVFTA